MANLETTTRNSVAIDTTPLKTHLGRRKRLLRRLSRIASSPQLHKSRHVQSTDKLLGKTSASCISLGSSRRCSIEEIRDGFEVRVAVEPHSPDVLRASTTVSSRKTQRADRPTVNPFTMIPDELKVRILRYLNDRELIVASGVCREWHMLCFDGQLWKTLDMTEYYNYIPAEQLIRIIAQTGPFINNLNIRGCLQLEPEFAEPKALKHCTNLRKVSLQGCDFTRPTIHHLLSINPQLESVNLVGLSKVANSTGSTIAKFNHRLQTLDVSWCLSMTAKSIRRIIMNCPDLKNLAASGIWGFGDPDIMNEAFLRNKLESLSLQGCDDFGDSAFKALIVGKNTPIDYLTGKPSVEPRKLRYLNLTGCPELTDSSIETLAGNCPDLEVLLLSNNAELTDHAFKQLLPTVPKLVTLELEEVNNITAEFCRALMDAPCARRLRSLQLSYCVNIPGEMLGELVQALPCLEKYEVDNTLATDDVVSKCLALVKERYSASPPDRRSPNIHLRCFDCPAITWGAINTALVENLGLRQADVAHPILTLHSFHSWQPTIDEHHKRMMRGHYTAAKNLQERWAEKMSGADRRRSRRRLTFLGRREDGERRVGCSIM
ncbi:RNI-like protein [Ascobolus immersus RN42]|uniref:RNI-like protein n=1 Tax=Ascobolus immersus RN42 TaxID=1160509 RepID=A0A3N4IVC5_ASCIM|nr:RNI-like protein [Ascobolus immersus RN42]